MTRRPEKHQTGYFIEGLRIWDTVFLERNEQIATDIDSIVEKIIGSYYETVDLEKENPKIELIIPDGYDSIPNDNNSHWALSFNQLLKEDSCYLRGFNFS